jgi:hypothetical protein
MIKVALKNNINLDFLLKLKWVFAYVDNNDIDILINNEKLENVKFIQIIFTDCVKNNEDNIYYYNFQENITCYIDIICEIIREKLCSIHVYGDSHSIITSKIPLCRENWLGFNTSYPLTMFRFGNEGLNLLECIKVMGNGHENYPIKKGDIAMYSYGEIDVRYLILKHCNKDTSYENFSGNYLNEYRDLDTLTDKLICNYIKKIKENEVTYCCKSFIYNIIPPAEITSGANLFTGTLEERKKLYIYFTNKLYNYCKKENIEVINIYNEIIDVNGCTKKDYLQGNGNGDIHLKLELYYLVRDKLLEKICYLKN